MNVLAGLMAESPWLATMGFALAGVIVALVFHHVVGLLARRHTVRAPIIHAMLVAIEKPAGAVLPLLALQVIWQAASSPGPRWR
jgi:hypothetical protein